MPPPSPHISSIGFTTANAEATADFFETNLGFSRGESLLLEAGPYAQLLGLAGSRLKPGRGPAAWAADPGRFPQLRPLVSAHLHRGERSGRRQRSGAPGNC
jgi:catechol 2,3-dioxygenase-like lactoylglutathione lyase family enzyme